ncbi:hypothetical protein ACHAXR_002809, partial [Thalassiosira sp. AJA248-18]
MMIHPIRIVVSAAMLHVSAVNGFAPSSMSRISSIHHTPTSYPKWQEGLPKSSTCLHSTDGKNGSGEEEAQRLQEKAKQYRNEAEKLRLTLGLQKVEELEKEIRDFMKGGDEEASLSGSEKRQNDKLQELKDRVQGLVQGSLGKEEADAMLAGLASFSSTSSATLESASTTDEDDLAALPELTPEELEAAIALLASLPTPVKDTLVRAAGGFSSYDSMPTDISNDRLLIRRLCAKEKNITAEELRRLYFQSFSENLPVPTEKLGEKDKEESEEEKYKVLGKSLVGLLSSQMEEELENGSTRAMELFPRSVQDVEEDLLPTGEDANVVFELLGRSFMATEKPMKVSGGYIIRGVNKRKSATELMDYLDGKLAKQSPEWTERYQMSFVEIYSDANDELFEDAILITPNKFAPLAPKLLAGVITAISLFSSVVYCIDAFGENEAVMEKLKSAVELAQDGG